MVELRKESAEATPARQRKPARRGRPTKTEGEASTRDIILDVAEDLFSKHGLHGVSIRDVANEAGVDTALLHYYFGTKRGLFDTVADDNLGPPAWPKRPERGSGTYSIRRNTLEVAYDNGPTRRIFFTTRDDPKDP